MKTENNEKFPPSTMANKPTFTYILVGLIFILCVYTYLTIDYPSVFKTHPELMDFEAFYIAGDMAQNGNVKDSYDIEATRLAQNKDIGGTDFMPWTYPPPFTMFVAALSLIPLGWAYLIFILASGLAYLWVLNRLAGSFLPGVLIALLPAAALVARSGQNGFLTGALVGLFALWFLKRKITAGIPLGLMIIKPHLAVTISLISLLERRWGAMAIAAGIVLFLLALSTWILGLEAWPAFLSAVGHSSDFLAKAYYPLKRMTSVYATFRSAGIIPQISMALQAITALTALGAIVWAWRKSVEPHLLMALVCACAVLISPYSYDYDLMIFGVGMALAISDVLAKSTILQRSILLMLVWLATGSGSVLTTTKKILIESPLTAWMTLLPSMGSIALLALVVLSAWILFRTPEKETATAS